MVISTFTFALIVIASIVVGMIIFSFFRKDDLRKLHEARQSLRKNWKDLERTDLPQYMDFTEDPLIVDLSSVIGSFSSCLIEGNKKRS